MTKTNETKAVEMTTEQIAALLAATWDHEARINENIEREMVESHKEVLQLTLVSIKSARKVLRKALES